MTSLAKGAVSAACFVLFAAACVPRSYEEVREFARSQLTATLNRLSVGSYPRNSLADGSWRTRPVSDWTSGFFVGLLWDMYGATADPTWRTAAERWTAPHSVNQFDTTTHDVGFTLMTSYGLGHRMTGSTAYREVLLTGAASLASRFNPVVGSIRSWDWGEWSYPVIIDNLMNLELLFYAASLGGDARLHEIAHAHALTTLRDHVRPDGSTFHLVDYDPATGAVRARRTYAGASDASTWSRGQAWAVYGFTMAYRYTNDPRFFDAAERTANYFIDHLPADSVPYWDFDAPGIPNTNRDSSAAAIAASGLLELASFSGDARAERYEAAAGAMLDRLSSDEYLATAGGSPGILLHGVGAFTFNVEVDVSLIYGDYYFMQALFRRATGRVHDF